MLTSGVFLKVQWRGYRKAQSKLYSVLSTWGHSLCGLFKSVPCFCFGSFVGFLPTRVLAQLSRSFSEQAPSFYLSKGRLVSSGSKLAERLGQGSSRDWRWMKVWTVCFLLPLLKVDKQKKKMGVVRNVCSDSDRAEAGQGRGAGAGS